MLRHLASVVSYAAVLVLFAATSVPAAQFGTAEEAKTMLERAVAEVKKDKATKPSICLTRATAALGTAIFMSSAQMSRTAS